MDVKKDVKKTEAKEAFEKKFDDIAKTGTAVRGPKTLGKTVFAVIIIIIIGLELTLGLSEQ